jgi:hypothetical protein
MGSSENSLPQLWNWKLYKIDPRYKVEMLWFILWAINKLNDRATTSQPRKGEGDWHTIIYGEKIQVVLM